jgi:L-cysteine/cystine lyase
MMKYLNYAALCPTHPQVEEVVNQTLIEFKSFLYSEAGIAWYLQTVEACRKKVATLLNVEDHHSIAFVSNASTANYLTLSFLPWSAEDGIITSSHENPSILTELQILEKRGVPLHTVAPTSPQNFLAHIQHLTEVHPIRAIVLSHVSHVDGRIFPLKDIAEIAKQHNILLIIDGAQAVGHIPVDLKALEYDIYFFTGHKWCQGPLGTGALVMNHRFLERTQQFAKECRETGKIPVTRWEIGTHNIGLIAGFAEACAIKIQEGLQNREQEVLRTQAKHHMRNQASVHVKEWDGPHAPGILSFHHHDHSNIYNELHNKWNIIVKQFTTYPEGEIPAIRMSWLGKKDLPTLEETLQKIERE